MKNLPLSLSHAAALLLLASCNGDLLVGERRCYGEGIDCSSDAPTLAPSSGDDVLQFDVSPARSVEPTWIYEPPIEFSWGERQLGPAPGGGVWMSHSSSTARELQRISAEGEPVESHPLNYEGRLSVDEELNPSLLTLLNGYLIRTVLGPQGEVIEQPIGREPLVIGNKSPTLNILMAGPEARVRVARYNAQDYYVAEYSPLGELLWKQTEFRGVRLPATAAVSYQAITLSDGAIALGLPKPGSIAFPGIESGAGQGITLIGPDGNVRWDMPLGGAATNTQLMAPAIDGGLMFVTGRGDGLEVLLLDRDGGPVAHWSGLRIGFHSVTAAAACTDSAGDVYVLVLTGERRKPMPTVCRMRGNDPRAEVVCLAVAGVTQLVSESASQWMGPMVAPEPGAVVFSRGELDFESEDRSSRLVRVDFEP